MPVQLLPRSHSGFYDPATHTQRPVVALDIDGTMGRYHEHFWRMACEYTGRVLPDPVDYKGDESFAKFLGLSKATYRRIKLAYRQGGWKRSMPAYEGVSDMSRMLRKRGAVVAICTTRPFLQLEVVDPDTRHWLKRQGVQYDTLISGEHKYRDLVRTFGRDRIVAVYEDLPEQALVCQDLGIPLFLRDQPYNQSIEGMKPWYGKRVFDAHEFRLEASLNIRKWKEEHLCD